jgi:hypothetical protein
MSESLFEMIVRQRGNVLGGSPWTPLGVVTMNKPAHRRSHSLMWAVWQSGSATLDTNAGTKVHFPFAGRIARIHAHVQTAPTTGDMSIDILADGNSIYHTSTKIVIPQNQTYGGPSLPDRISFQQDTEMYVKAVTIQDAVGPLRVVIGFEPEFQN